MKRQICDRCEYPIKVCICHEIITCRSPASIHILQHPSETHHAKNTARLVKLSIDDCHIHIGEKPNDFASVRPLLSRAWVVYPSETSRAIESVNSDTRLPPPKQLIVIDGTWRKAFKIWQLNPWLHQLPCVHFANAPTTQYRIRKSTVAHGMSTLEATAYALESLYALDMTPLRKTLFAMQSHWQGQQQ